MERNEFPNNCMPCNITLNAQYKYMVNIKQKLVTLMKYVGSVLDRKLERPVVMYETPPL